MPDEMRWMIVVGAGVATLVAVTIALCPPGWPKTKPYFQKPYFRYWLPALFAALVVGVVTKPQGPPTAERSPAAQASIPECDHDHTGITGFSATGQLATSGAITSVPEYHDCQRFLLPSDFKKYGALQAVFARINLRDIYQDDTYGLRPANALGNIATIVTTPRFKDILPAYTAAPNSVLRVVTVGVVLSDGPYAPLGITQKFQCVILAWLDGRPQAGYAALMWPVTDEKTCTDEANLPGTYPVKTLYVKSINLPANQLPAVPAVARWDFDYQQGLYYAGIMCPTGWCEVHAEPNQYSSPDYEPELADASLGAGHVVKLKGYYDEQYLSDVRGWRNGREDVIGTVFPVPDLDKRTMQHYKDEAWLPVAWVVLNGSTTKYHSYKGFGSLTTIGNHRPGKKADRTEVSLCFVPTPPSGSAADEALAARAKCKVPLKMEESARKCKKDENNGGKWYARVKVGEQRGRLFCVINRPLPTNAPAPPPVVRWRWSANDETIWIPCPAACCEKEIDETCSPEDEDCEVYEEQ